jgi:hypothetical protein
MRPENQENAAGFWRELGLTFTEICLPKEGLRVLVDFSAGIEVVSPVEPAGTLTDSFRAFLNERGEGIFTVVMRTEDVQAPVSTALRHGATVLYQNRTDVGGVIVDEATLTPVRAMPVTFIATHKSG